MNLSALYDAVALERVPVEEWARWLDKAAGGQGVAAPTSPRRGGTPVRPHSGTVGGSLGFGGNGGSSGTGIGGAGLPDGTSPQGARHGRGPSRPARVVGFDEGAQR